MLRPSVGWPEAPADPRVPFGAGICTRPSAGDTAAAALWYASLLDGFDYVYASAAHERLATLLQRSEPARADAHRREHQRLTRR